MASLDAQNADSDNNIQVFVRIRPPNPDEPVFTRVVDVDPSGKQVLLKQEPGPPRVFSFDHVADINSTQETIFNRLGKKVIENCMSGYNGTIFAYGQTGSGKTFTMMGPSEDDADNLTSSLRGVIPRSFEHLYNLIEREKELHGDAIQFLCKCSFLEIYKEQIFDLLEPTSTILHLRESLKSGVYVSGLSEKVVTDASEAYEVLTSSWMNRKVAATAMNRESSRSHAVFTLFIESKEKRGCVEHIKTSQLNLVDLAGSERQKDTQSSGIRLKEAGCINKSLSDLGNVIMALVTKKRYIPYRDSKLTFLLRDSLGGNAKTSLVACVHAGHRCFGETLSTLQFAKRAKMIKNKAILNENAMGNISQLQAEIALLKEELVKYKSGAASMPQHSLAVSVDNMCELKQMFIQAMYLRMKAEEDNTEIAETMIKLKELIGKKDKAIQTNKMIIKFRDNNIRRLEEKLKGQDVNIANNEDTEKEIQALRSLLEHNPDMARYAQEARQLKVQLNKLQEEPGFIQAVLADQNRVQDLNEMFQKLVTEQQEENKDTEQTPGQSKEALRTEKAELGAKIQELDEQLVDLRQSADKKQLHLQSELESAHKTIKELEILLAANNVKTKLEKAALNERHFQTVKSIITPKKELYNLRNRTVTLSKTPDLETTIPFEMETEAGAAGCGLFSPLREAGIMEEEMITQQENEVLLDQIKQLQDQISNMEERISEFDTDRVKQLHQISLLEADMKLSKQFLEDEQKTVVSQKEEVHKAAALLKHMTEERDNIKSENDDLQLMLTQTYREIKDHKERYKNKDTETNDQLETVMSKMSELEVLLQHLGKENEKLEEEKETLNSNLENEIDTRAFFENLSTRYENELKEKDSNIEKLQAQIQLSTQSEQEMKEKESQANTQYAVEIKAKECEIEKLQVQIQESEAYSVEKDSQIEKLQSEIKDSQQSAVEIESQMEKLQVQIQDSQQYAVEKDSQIEKLQSQIQDSQQSAVEKDSQIEKLQSENQLSKQYAVDITEKVTQIEKLQAQNEKLEIFQAQYQNATSKMTVMMFKCDELEREKTDLQDTVTRLETVASQFEEERARLVAENTTVKGDLEHFKQNLACINEMCRGSYDSAVSMDDVVDILKSSLEDKEQLHEMVANRGSHANHRQKISVMHRYKERQKQLEEENVSLSMKTKHLEEQVRVLRSEKEKSKSHRSPLKEHNQNTAVTNENS